MIDYSRLKDYNRKRDYIKITMKTLERRGDFNEISNVKRVRLRKRKMQRNLPDTT